MSKVNILQCASSLQSAWRSTFVGQIGDAQFKVLRMDGSAYPSESHAFNEALLVMDGVLNLQIRGSLAEVHAGEVFIVPAGTPHAVAPGSTGTLVIIDQKVGAV